jgi:hypothetical protein
MQLIFLLLVLWVALCHGLSLSFPMSNPRLTFGEMRLPILH